MQTIISNKTFFLLLMSILIGVTVVSCTAKKKSDIEFDNIRVNKTIGLLSDSNSNQPYANVAIDFLYPKTFGDNSKLQELQKLFVATFFKEVENNNGEIVDYTSMSPEDAVKNYLLDYSRDYKELASQFNLEVDLLSEAEMPSWYSFTKALYDTVLFENNKILCYTVFDESYTGGAHGMFNTFHYVIDLDKVQMIREEDLFIPNYQDKLSAIIMKQLMIDYDSENKEEFINESSIDPEIVVPNQNFWIDETGLHYSFNPYEVGPYTIGIVDVTIPFEELKPILSDESYITHFLKDKDK